MPRMGDARTLTPSVESLAVHRAHSHLNKFEHAGACRRVEPLTKPLAAATLSLAYGASSGALLLSGQAGGRANPQPAAAVVLCTLGVGGA